MSVVLPVSLSLPSSTSVLGMSQQLFRQELESGGAVLTPLSWESLERSSSEHALHGVLRDVRESGTLTRASTAAWQVDLTRFQGDSKAREVLGHNATLVRMGYLPESVGSFLFDSSLVLAAVTSIHPSDFRLEPLAHMTTIEGLAKILERDAWPLYTGGERVRIHGYWASPYGAAMHDVLHFLAWKRWTREDRLDSIVLYRAMKSVVTTQMPSLGSLASRLGGKLFYGDGFFYREITAMDECLSGPPGTGNGIFAETTLLNAASCLEGDRSRFYRAVEKAFSGHPREERWREALRRIID